VFGRVGVERHEYVFILGIVDTPFLTILSRNLRISNRQNNRGIGLSNPTRIEKLPKDENCCSRAGIWCSTMKDSREQWEEIEALVYKGLPSPELGKVPGIRDAVSVIITVPVHLEFSRNAGWSIDDPNLGSVLIGFNE
jgi:hypothetical protein